MLTMVDKTSAPIPIVVISGDLASADATQSLCNEISALQTEGTDRAMLWIPEASPASTGAVFTLIEVASRSIGIQLGFAVESKPLFRLLGQFGISRHLRIYKDVASGLAQLVRPQDRLGSLSTVVLAAGAGTRMAPLSNECAKPMLDIAGHSLLRRLTDHLWQQGVRDVLINPGHHGPDLMENFVAPQGMSVRYYPEGARQNGVWSAAPLGSASTLIGLEQHFKALQGEDLLVMCGDCLTDIDIADMLDKHRASAADITIAAKTVPLPMVERYGIIVADEAGRITSFQEKPPQANALSQLANIGIYLFKRSILADMPEGEGQDIGNDLIAHAQAAGRKLQLFHANATWLDVGCPEDYFAASTSVLTGAHLSMQPTGQQIQPGIWAERDVELPHDVKIEGPCHIQCGSRIEPGTTIEGPVLIGKDCVVGQGATLRNAILMADTHVSSGAELDGLIAGPQFVIRHTRAKPETNAKANDDQLTVSTALNVQFG